MKVLFLGFFAALFVAGAASANCPTPPQAPGTLFIAGATQLTWCWPSVTGGTGPITYTIESKTNVGGWLQEGTSSNPEWTTLRNIGDVVNIRYFACDDLACTGYSPESQNLMVLDDFDANGDGVIGGPDFAAWRAYLDQTTLAWFGQVFGRNIVDGIYIK